MYSEHEIASDANNNLRDMTLGSVDHQLGPADDLLILNLGVNKSEG